MTKIKNYVSNWYNGLSLQWKIFVWSTAMFVSAVIWLPLLIPVGFLAYLYLDKELNKTVPKKEEQLELPLPETPLPEAPLPEKTDEQKPV